jgi:aryl carrier-like protein
MSLRPAGPPPTLEQVRALVASILQKPSSDIPIDADLLELGLDSLGMVRVINLWRRAGIRISLDDLTAEPTLAAWQQLTSTTADHPA